MKNKIKHIQRVAALFLSAVLTSSLLCTPALAASITDSNVFIKQASASTCTLASATMMLRRHAILDGVSDWNTITESAVKSTAWADGSGMKFSFSYRGMSVVTQGVISAGYTTVSAKKSYFISMLNSHPEGIVIYAHSVPNASPHAVLLTDYDNTTETFYCADPSRGASTGRIKLANSTLPGNSQNDKIGNIKQIWYINSGSAAGSSTGNPTIWPQYFDCDVRIDCVNGQTVNLYNHPGDTSRADYFSKGQSARGTYGAKLSDGSTWYRITATSNGVVKTFWLKYESSKMTVSNIVTTHTIWFNANGGSVSANSKTVTAGSTYGTLPTPARTGYTFSGWYTASSGGTQITASTVVNLSSSQITLYAHWASADVAYKVRHYQESLSGGYTLADTDVLTGTTGKTVTPATNNYTGFQSPPAQSAVAAADGSTVISYYYSRNRYSLTLRAGSGIQSVNGGGTYRYGENVTVTAQLESNYEWLSWSSSTSNLGSSQQTYQFTMPASNVTLTASAQQQKDPCADGHTWGAWITLRASTCTQEGLRVRICTKCSNQNTGTTAALGHSYRQSGNACICINCGDVRSNGNGTNANGLDNFKHTCTYYDGLFWDVSSNSWYVDNVSSAYQFGLMKGQSANMFSPESNVTYAEAITLAARIHSIYYYGKENFETYDGGNWYDPYVNYARANNISTANYIYNQSATREEFVHILVNALPKEALTEIPGKILDFADKQSIVYSGDVDRLCRAGVINGVDAGGITYFMPAKTVTRAESAAIVARMVQPNLRIS